jgi:hypothetical protein
LPPVYTSGVDASFLDPRRFMELMLFTVAHPTRMEEERQAVWSPPISASLRSRS